jgi:hypothetical protein
MAKRSTPAILRSEATSAIGNEEWWCWDDGAVFEGSCVIACVTNTEVPVTVSVKERVTSDGKPNILLADWLGTFSTGCERELARSDGITESSGPAGDRLELTVVPPEVIRGENDFDTLWGVPPELSSGADDAGGLDTVPSGDLEMRSARVYGLKCSERALRAEC